MTDLTGQPYQPADRDLEAAHARVDGVWRLMLAHPLNDPPEADLARTEPWPLDRLEAETGLISALYNRCDYAGVTARLIDLIPPMHASAHARHARAALERAVTVYGVAMGTLLNLGYPAQAWLAAQRCQEAAERLGDPVAIAVAACNSARVQAHSGAWAPARTTVTRAADTLEHQLALPAALETFGFLHLACALHTIGLGQHGQARDLLAEAHKIATRTGETISWDLVFGPSNVALWQMAADLDVGEPGRALTAARTVRVQQLPQTRQVAFYLDLARGYMQVGGRDGDALTTLLTAERVAPQYTRSSTPARQAARQLLTSSTPSVARSSTLRGLCERLGVAA